VITGHTLPPGHVRFVDSPQTAIPFVTGLRLFRTPGFAVPTELLVLLPIAAAGDRINLKEPHLSGVYLSTGLSPATGFFHKDLHL
jgi:hypothetical protein